MQNAHDGQGALASRMVDLGALGVVTVTASDRAILAITFTAPPRTRPVEHGLRPRDALLARAARELAEYAAGARTTFSLPTAAAGTAFQREVWAALGTIPFGETRSYADVARAVGRPRAVRAVGAANGKNPLLLVVPCHRVIGGQGDLTGYAGGLPRKAGLLAHERARRVVCRA